MWRGLPPACARARSANVAAGPLRFGKDAARTSEQSRSSHVRPRRPASVGAVGGHHSRLRSMVGEPQRTNNQAAVRRRETKDEFVLDTDEIGYG